MNLDFKNLSEEDKRKYIVYGIFGIVAIIVLGICMSFVGGKDTANKDVNSIDVPLSSEQEQYETRLKALQKFDTVKPDPDQRMTQFFARKGSNQDAENLEYFEKNKANNSSNESQNYNYEPISSNVDSKSPIKKTNNSGAGNYNKYGNSSMWTVEEPKNNNIGYSSTNRDYVEKRIQQLEERETRTEINTSPSIATNQQSNPPANKINKKQLFENGKQNGNGTIKAVIRGTQDIKNGQTLRFQTSEEGFSNGVKIPRNTSMYGVVRFNQYRAEISIETANINGNIVPVNLIVYSNDGIKGIPISIDESVQQGRNSAVDEIGRKGGMVGKAGSIVAGVITSKAKEPTIKFIDNQKILLIQK